MNLAALFRARVKACLRDVLSLLFLLLALVIALSAAYLTAEKTADPLSVALVNEDTGKYGGKLSESLMAEDYMKVTVMPLDAAMTMLRQDRLESVIVIRDNFSESILNGEFENSLALYNSPASNAGITVSEPAINKTIAMWVGEFARLKASDFLAERGEAFTSGELSDFRNALDDIWQSGSGIEMATEYIDGSSESATTENPGIFQAAAGWYAVFCMFYLIAGASWVMDTKNTRLYTRAARSGASAWKLTAASAPAPFLLAVCGYLVAGLSVCAIFSLPFSNVFIYLPAMTVYLAGALCMTLVFASALTDTTTLLFFAPVLTFLNAALSGMINPLPEWASVLKTLSGALPGRWLTGALSGSLSDLLYGGLCALCWLLLSRIVSLLRELKERNAHVIKGL
ncbi:MAG: ABC transporter permease [Clostridia bacterium]|nr:ABC transporter permease [Clostridia bacterium]